MSDKNLSRRAETQVVFGGVDLTLALNKGWMSFSYVDNEEDEADDLQIKVYDRDGKWAREWLNTLISDTASGGEIISSPEQAGASGGSSGSSGGSGSTGKKRYKVTASTGVNIRAGAGEKKKVLGKLPCGTVVDVSGWSGSWARISYSGKTGYIKGANLKALGVTASSSGTSGTSEANGSKTSSSSNNSENPNSWNVGDEVTVSGAPWGDSYGSSHQGWNVTDHKGKITYLNLKAGVPYPICVDQLGWFSESAVRKTDENLGIAGDDGEGLSSGSRGLKISAVITRVNANGDGAEEELDCGQFEIDDVEAQGPPATVTIKGTSLSYSNSVRQTLKSRSWENTTLSEITRTIASQNGMGALFESAYDPKYSRTEQFRMSDISFLQKLCHDAGCSLKATNNILVVFDQAKYESLPAVRTIKFGEGYTKYKISTETNSTYTSCRVYYTASDGTVISATEYIEGYNADSKTQQCLEVRQKVSSVGEAQKLAHKILRLHNKFETTASFTLPGDTNLAAGNTVLLSGFGFGDGKYIIKQANHSISSSGYTTQIALRKCLEDNECDNSGAVGDTSANGAGMSSDSNEELDRLAYEVAILGIWGAGQARYDKLTAAGHDYYAVQKRVNELYYS